MLPGDSVVLLFQRLQTAGQWIGELQLVFLVFGACFVVAHGRLHLLDRLDQALRLFGQLVLFVGDSAQLAMESVGERREELQNSQLRRADACTGANAYLCLARVALMAGNTNLIEQVVQLADDGRDLLREIAGVHVGCRLPAASTVAYAL